MESMRPRFKVPSACSGLRSPTAIPAEQAPLASPRRSPFSSPLPCPHAAPGPLQVLNEYYAAVDSQVAMDTQVSLGVHWDT